MDYQVDKVGGDDFTMWLVTRFRGEDCSIVHEGEPLLYITPADVHDAFKLPLCPDKPVNLSMSPEVSSITEALFSKYKIRGGGVGCDKPDMNEIRKVLLHEKVVNDDFIRLFVAYAVSCFLAPVAMETMDFMTLSSTLKIDEIKGYDWCSFVLARTASAAAQFNLETSGRETPRTFLGCLILLQITFVQRLQTMWPKHHNSIPYVGYWSQKMLEKRIQELTVAGGYGEAFKVNDKSFVAPLHGQTKGIGTEVSLPAKHRLEDVHVDEHEPWHSWPANDASIYYSAAVLDVIRRNPPFPSYKLEIADFCISKHVTRTDRLSFILI